jgi:ribosomal protein L7/L12
MIELSGPASVMAVVLVVFVLLRLVSIESRIAALSRIDVKLDLLLDQAGIEFDSYKNLPRQVTEALQRGEKIKAIKHYREATGVGLKEAKEFIDEIQRRAGSSA